MKERVYVRKAKENPFVAVYEMGEKEKRKIFSSVSEMVHWVRLNKQFSDFSLKNLEYNA